MGIEAIIGTIVASLILSVIGGYATFYVSTRERLAKMEVKIENVPKMSQEVTELKTLCRDLSQMQKDVACLMAYNNVVKSVIDPHMAGIIHSPEHIRRDELVDKLITNIIQPGELDELKILLHQAITENHESGKRIAAAFLLARAESQSLIVRGEIDGDCR
jgi:hypothetical protein